MKPRHSENDPAARFTAAERDHGGIKEVIFIVAGGMVFILLLMMVANVIAPAYTPWAYALGALLFVAGAVFLVVRGSRLWQAPRRPGS